MLAGVDDVYTIDRDIVNHHDILSYYVSDLRAVLARVKCWFDAMASLRGRATLVCGCRMHKSADQRAGATSSVGCGSLVLRILPELE
jgi:hypothetical protein